ncbi:type II toxin-antitoxin system VapC family toxin [Occallatibacter riparius]|uniref:Ribonuclease VapC n=1 Tax=Occallatibacter riparius TaxID=1002689 RepID=A0A9J7BW41_9BACT|nr:type II toxin-antitoxin system VapC family toxin [Occallatibacter riparius]UWZ86018.1 type II toxin-antitoxin system VapC family toxin [Occallatibacter riparius]
MAQRYVLDTNILSDLLKSPAGKVAQKIAGLAIAERESLATSIVVAAELRYGAAKSGSQILAERIEQLLGAIEVLPLEPDADGHYGIIRSQLEKTGTVIGANDLLIAAHVLAIDGILVTDNLREFKRVKGLRVENWLRA